MIGDMIQSNIDQATRITVKNRPNALLRADWGACIWDTAFSLGRGEGGGSWAFLGVRRRGEGAARAVVRTLAGELVRLIEEVTLSVSARLLLDAFFGVVDISNPRSGSDSLSKSSQSWLSFSGRVYCAEIRELLGPAVGVDALVPCDCRIGVDMND